MPELPKIDFIFYHIEKCGGTSMRRTLYDYFMYLYKTNQIFDPELSNDYNIQFNKKNIEIIKKDNHFDYNNLKVIVGHTRVYDLPSLFINTPLKITILRDPVDRIISHYYSFDKISHNNSELIDLPENIFKKYCQGHGCHMCRVLHCMDKDNYLSVNKIKTIITQFTYILILENIEEDIKILNKLLNKYYNVNYNIQLNFINVNENKKIKNIELLKEKIKKYCEYDYTLYNIVKIYNKSNHQ